MRNDFNGSLLESITILKGSELITNQRLDAAGLHQIRPLLGAGGQGISILRECRDGVFLDDFYPLLKRAAFFPKLERVLSHFQVVYEIQQRSL